MEFFGFRKTELSETEKTVTIQVMIAQLILYQLFDSVNLNEIRESLSAVNMVSLAEAMAYQELGESAAARQSLQYYAGYLQSAYLSTEGLVQRLDLIDPTPENYWSKTLPDIKQKIQALPCVENVPLLEGEDNVRYVRSVKNHFQKDINIRSVNPAEMHRYRV